MSAGVARPNYTQVPNRLLDEWLPQIDTLGELKVALAITRATWGWQDVGPDGFAVLSLSTLERRTGLGRAAVVAGLKAAHARGYVDKVAAGQGFAYGLVVDGEVVRRANQCDERTTPEGSDDRTTASPTSEPVGSATSEPVLKKGGKKASGGKKDTAPEQDQLLSGDGRPCPRTVVGADGSRHRVTAEECSAAWRVMDAFNAAAGTRVSAKGFVEKILRRMREHPELSVEDHERVIAAVLGGRQWWTGRPDPAIIYGSDEQFDRCLNNAPARGPSGASVQSGGVQTDDDDWDSSVRYS